MAFKVAEEELGITRLLDAEDVANVARPDEKSIVAYVSQFFKLFAKASKNDALVKSIRTAVEVTKVGSPPTPLFTFSCFCLLH